tara:strand:+ start:722 stop:1354 length:633 start_codon:yes stop_codon:yes gene_type:complete
METLSTSKWREYRDYTIDRFDSTGVDYDPYWHVFIEDILHPELYETVLMEWPDFETCAWAKNVPGQNQHRKIFNPDRDDEHRIQFWQDYFDCMVNDEAIISAAYRLEGLHSLPDYVTASVWEDYAGYSVSNHVDAYTIDLAWQTYIYCSGGEGWGTSLNDSNGNQLKRFPFKPNSGWLMRVDSESWHSCDTVDCDVRRSVMARFMTKQRG